MGNNSGLCDAITRAQVFQQQVTGQQAIKKFIQAHPGINAYLQKTNQSQTKFNLLPAHKYAQGSYIGPVSNKNLPQTSDLERGIFLYQQFYYEGELREGKRHGQGLMINKEGDFYQGGWMENYPEGDGTYQVAESDRKYEGQWKRGLRHGTGIESYQDGSFYQGVFFQGKKSGVGKLHYPDGTSYSGQFIDNTIHGTGYSSGKFHTYQGQWQNGKMHGNGISTWNDDKGQLLGHYVGQYKNGLKDGYGEYTWGQKKVYKGKWTEGDMSSQGVLLNYEA